MPGSRRAKTAIGVAVLAIGIQLVPVDRSNPPVGTVIDPPAEVERVMRAACWNCHSNETEWPWYAHVAPVSWYVTDHVRDGREDLNFTEWPAGDADEVRDLAEEVGEQIEADAMPPTTYRWMHPGARLTEEEKQILLDWSMATGDLDRLPGAGAQSPAPGG